MLKIRPFISEHAHNSLSKLLFYSEWTIVMLSRQACMYCQTSATDPEPRGKSEECACHTSLLQFALVANWHSHQMLFAEQLLASLHP